MQAFQVKYMASGTEALVNAVTTKIVRAADWSEVVQVAMKVLQTKDIINIQSLGEIIE